MASHGIKVFSSDGRLFFDTDFRTYVPLEYGSVQVTPIPGQGGVFYVFFPMPVVGTVLAVKKPKVGISLDPFVYNPYIVNDRAITFAYTNNGNAVIDYVILKVDNSIGGTGYGLSVKNSSGIETFNSNAPRFVITQTISTAGGLLHNGTLQVTLAEDEYVLIDASLISHIQLEQIEGLRYSYLLSVTLGYYNNAHWLNFYRQMGDYGEPARMLLKSNEASPPAVVQQHLVIGKIV